MSKRPSKKRQVKRAAAEAKLSAALKAGREQEKPVVKPLYDPHTGELRSKKPDAPIEHPSMKEIEAQARLDGAPLPETTHEKFTIRFLERVQYLKQRKGFTEEQARDTVARALMKEGFTIGRVVTYYDQGYRSGYLADAITGDQFLKIQPIGAYGRELARPIHVKLENVVAIESEIAKEDVMAAMKKAKSAKAAVKGAAPKKAAKSANGKVGRAPVEINSIKLLRLPKEGERLAKQPLAFLKALEEAKGKTMDFADLVKAAAKQGVKTVRPWDAIFRLRRPALVKNGFIAVS